MGNEMKMSGGVRLMAVAMFAAVVGFGQTVAAPDQCVIALSQVAANAMSLGGNVNVTAPNCGVAVNSAATNALRLNGGARLTAKYVRVKGGVSLVGSAAVTPAAQTNAALTPDPLTFLQRPETDHCDYTDFSVNGGTTALNPGTYCNGITASGGAVLNFSPGMYILMGGGLRASGTSRLNGTDVTFFLTEGLGKSYGPLAISGSAVVNLKAPTSPALAYYGILFYQDPRIGIGKAGSTLSGSADLPADGVFYFPTTNLTWAGNASASASNYMILIADTLNVTGNGSLNTTYPGGRTPLLPPITLSINPGTARVAAGLSQQFTALIGNATNAAVTWTVSPANLGTISNTGLFAAAANVTAPQTAIVTVTSVEDPTKSATATVTVNPPVSVVIAPGAATLYGGQSVPFVSTVVNTDNLGVIWSLAPAGVGSITATGVYSAPAVITTQQTVTVRATSVADPTKWAVATVTLMPPVAVSVAPATVSLYGGQTQAFTASVVNTSNTAVTWTVIPAGAGTITAGGVYTAPAVVQTAQNVTIRATSVADPSKSATATVGLVPLSVSVAPASVTLYSSQTQQFAATVSNTNDPRVGWSISPAGVGTITAAGLYTAPAIISAPQLVTITATSLADPTKSAVASVNLVGVVSVTITPRTLLLAPGQTHQFVATVENAANTAVVWSLSPAGALSGTITATGLYTAPACLSGDVTVSVIATSVADPTKSVSATVTVRNATGYSYQRPLVIDRTKVPSTLTNFPMLFTGTYPFLAGAAFGGKVQHPNGFDIIFASDQAGANKLDHEVESYNPATGQITAWVRIPVLSSTADTIIYLVYGNAGVTTSQQNRAGVWDANFKGVYHMSNGVALSAADATAAGNNGSVVGAAAGAGYADGAALFNGTSSYVELPAALFAGYPNITFSVSLWMKTAVPGGIFAQTGGQLPPTLATGYNVPALYVDTAGKLRSSFFWHGVQSRQIVTSGTYNDNNWHHVMVTYAANLERLYVDGVLVGSQPYEQRTTTNTYRYALGTAYTGNWAAGNGNWFYYNGTLDELKVSNVTRSADWVRTEYNNQSSPASFYKLNGENSVTVLVSPSSVGLYGGQSQGYSATVVGGCTGSVVWSVVGAGTVSASGVYTAPAAIPVQATATVVATSVETGGVTGSGTVILLPPAVVTMSPGSVTLFNGQKQQFLASVSNALNTGVSWTVSPSGVGSMSASGLYTAPSVITTQQVLSVTATSVADPTKFATALVTLIPGQGTVVSGNTFTPALDLVAGALCRRPHAPPVVNAGAEQFVRLSCPVGGSCGASVTLAGSASNYSLEPGQQLTYAWSVATGPAPVAFANANAASTGASFTTAGNYTLQLAVNDGVSTATGLTYVTVSPAASGSSGSLYITPTASGPNAVSSTAPFLIKWVGFFFGTFNVVNGRVNLTVTGANPRTAQVITDSNGTAAFSYVGVNAGTDTITATATSNTGDVFQSNPVVVTWIAPVPQLTTSGITGRFFSADGAGTFNTPGTQQPVFTQQFPNINFNPVDPLKRPFTDVVMDGAGTAVGLIPAEGNNSQAGVGSLYNFAAVFTGNFHVPSAGQVVFTITADDGFVFGVGNGAVRADGPQVGVPAATAFTNLAVMGGVNQRSAVAARTITVNFPAAGVYPFELDYAKGGDNKLVLTLQANGSAIPASVLLTLGPTAPASLTAGQVQSFTVKAVDANGVAQQALPVVLTIRGVNQQGQQLTTDGTGQVGFSYAGSPLLTGTDYVQAAAVVGSTAVYSNVVVVPWNSGVNAAPVVSGGPGISVALPGVAVLTGIVSDDGLPAPAVTVTWSKLSGPGTVTFDHPGQAATAAAFSAPGTYVLQLSATDGALTSNATVTVMVTANPNWSPGWMQSPVDKSTVSGLVPVTLAPGVTLTGGTLTYYSTANPGDVRTLVANTTGSGQIAVFDTTSIPNGAYFMELRATNSAGVTQSNLAFVTVAGDYKPGRVTATVTDLTVPAPGLAIRISRVYDSLHRNEVGDFGYGWRLDTSVQLSVAPTGDVTFTLNGRRRTFYLTPQSNPLFPNWYLPEFTAEPGMYGRLTTTGDTCTGLLQRIGNLWFCALNNAGAIYQATGYVYTDPVGTQFTIGGTGQLQSIRDLNGNTITIAPTGISSNSGGLNVPFVRDANGRITRITDTLGNNWQYAYDANGNLSTVTLPSIAQPVTYGYDAAHLLTSERDPRGSTASTIYYPDGKLRSVTDEVGNTTSYAYNVATNTTTVTNPDGGTITTVADAYGMPLSVTDPLGRNTTYTYDARHNRLTETNALGQTTTSTYDSNGFRNSVRDPLGNTISTVFNTIGKPTSETNENGGVTTATYDSVFNLTTVADSLGQALAFTYNAQGLPLTRRDARGNASTFVYDANGNRTRDTDALGRVTQTTYDSMGRLLNRTDPRGGTTSHAYDSLGRRTTMTDALGGVTRYTFDSNGNNLSEIDPLGRTTTFTYDAANRLTQKTYPDNTTQSYTYDFRDNKLTETDELGRVTKWVYDLAGQLSSITKAFGTADAATTSYTYDLAGRKVTETDPRGNTTSLSYDAAGRMVSMRDAAGNVTSYAHDGRGQVTALTDPKNRVTTYSYDARRRRVTTTTPDGKTVSRTYDGLGMVTRLRDEESRDTVFAYDAASQVTAVTDALNNITRYSYDANGNKASQTDANGRATTYTWDALNRRTTRTLPLGMSETYSYDAMGNMLTKMDFNGRTTSYTYDSRNRILTRTPAAVFNTPAVRFTYTATGKRLSMVDSSGTTTYTYTNRDQVTTKATPQGTLAYSYDLSGNVTSVVSSNANGTNVSYAWDGVNRLQSVTDNRTGGMTSFAHDGTSQLVSMQYPNGVVHSMTYDNRDRQTGLTVAAAQGVLASYSQTFGAAGHKLTVAEGSGRAENYAYDGIYRLSSQTIAGDSSASANGTLTYGLDAVGNRLSLSSTVAGISSQSNTYDANDRLGSETFDANGNTLTAGGHTFAYDFEDRLIRYDATVEMLYDGDGNRVSRTEAGSTVRYLVDDQTPTGYPQVAEEVVQGAVVAQYTYGRLRISQRRNGVASYYGYDAGGSVRQIVNVNGAVTDTYGYDAFGNTISRTGSTVNPFLYRGEQYDDAMELYYLRARYYRSRVGRFLTADKYERPGPCECDAGDRPLPPMGTHHLYEYAEADPVNRIDPTGLKAIEAGMRYPTLERGKLMAEAFGCGVSLGLMTAQIVFADGGFAGLSNFATGTGCFIAHWRSGAFVSGDLAALTLFAPVGQTLCLVQLYDFANAFQQLINRDPRDARFPNELYRATLASFDTAFGCMLGYRLSRL